MAEETGLSRWSELYPLMCELGNSLDLADTLAVLDTRLRALFGASGIAISTLRDGSLTALSEAAPPARCALAVPLEAGHAFAGRLVLYRDAPPFSPREREMLAELAPKTSAALANALRWRRLEALAAVDADSGVSTRRALFLALDAELERCRRTGAVCGVLVCRPEASPAALEAVARRLRESCREYDTIARSGADLILVLPGLEPEQARRKYWQVRDVVELEAPGAALAAGAAFFPADGADTEDLLASAAARLRSGRPPFGGLRR